MLEIVLMCFALFLAGVGCVWVNWNKFTKEDEELKRKQRENQRKEYMQMLIGVVEHFTVFLGYTTPQYHAWFHEGMVLIDCNKEVPFNLSVIYSRLRDYVLEIDLALKSCNADLLKLTRKLEMLSHEEPCLAVNEKVIDLNEKIKDLNDEIYRMTYEKNIIESYVVEIKRLSNNRLCFVFNKK